MIERVLLHEDGILRHRAGGGPASLTGAVAVVMTARGYSVLKTKAHL
ncbi:MAG: hypothetical protein ACRDM1_11235 [Gaiellaceae bacterium]